MSDEELIYSLENHGRIVALELLMRAVYHKMALGTDDPEGFITRSVEQICTGIDARAATDVRERVILESAVQYLHHFERNTLLRFDPDWNPEG